VELCLFSPWVSVWRGHRHLYLLTSWCRVLLEKLTGLQLVKKFPAFHGTRRFFTALTSVRHLPLSWACPIQSIYPHPTSWRSILILSTHLHGRLYLLENYDDILRLLMIKYTEYFRTEFNGVRKSVSKKNRV